MDWKKFVVESHAGKQTSGDHASCSLRDVSRQPVKPQLAGLGLNHPAGPDREKLQRQSWESAQRSILYLLFDRTTLLGPPTFARANGPWSVAPSSPGSHPARALLGTNGGPTDP